MPLDHFLYLVRSSHFDEEIAFLTGAFAHMGLKQLNSPAPGVVGLGDEGKPWLWVSCLDRNYQRIKDDVPISIVHVALSAKDQQQVQDFHSAALKAGGKDNGAPGLRENYAPDYYGAFVISPGGHNIECVHRGGN